MSENYFAVFRELLQLAHRYHSRCSDKQKLKLTDDLPIMQKHVIHYILSRNEAVYQRDIEREFLISRSTASTMLKSLETKGIIKRITDSKDARLKELIVVSPYKEQFQEIYEVMMQKMVQISKQMCQGIASEDLKVFDKVLEQMKNNLQK